MVHHVFEWWLARITEQGGLCVDYQVYLFVGETSAYIFWWDLYELGETVVELSLQLSLQERASFFCLVDPLSVGVAKIEADIDHIAVILKLVSIQIHQLDLNAEVPILVNSLRKGFSKYQSILVSASSKELNSEIVTWFMTSLGLSDLTL